MSLAILSVSGRRIGQESMGKKRKVTRMKGPKMNIWSYLVLRRSSETAGT